MKTITSPAYSNQQNIEILDGFSVHLDIAHNPYQIPLNKLFTMAARRNPKRAFLFVSKVLGKHLPADPNTCLLAGAALAAQYLEAVYDLRPKDTTDIIEGLKGHKEIRAVGGWAFLPEETIFIGFAETATALGLSMFNCFSGHAEYLHTTRELIPELNSLIEFEEEHSHATSHRLYSFNKKILANKKPIVLVDDEVTTGKTALNIIEAIQRKYPRERYVVASLLDWMTDADRARFNDTEKRFKINIETVSLIRGSLKVSNNLPELPISLGLTIAQENQTIKIISAASKPTVCKAASINSKGTTSNVPYLTTTGRFGQINKETLEHQICEVAKKLSMLRTGDKTLCLGTGEFMYLPMRIAAELGPGVKYQSTTRSPIYANQKPEYPIKSYLQFPCPDDPRIVNYVYNIPPDYYDEVFIFIERKPLDLSGFMATLKGLGIPKIYLVIFAAEDTLVKEPQPMGSYAPEDVVFLLKDLQGVNLEKATEYREEVIQSGGHYSEMLPIEYTPSAEYVQLYKKSLAETAEKIAVAAGCVAEAIIKNRGLNVVLVSLARAGTPIGILIKRYLACKYKLHLPHYSISIIRGKGLDENALTYILQRHPGFAIQFIDGWTGKGAITHVLGQACNEFRQKYGVHLSEDLAVLADPGYCVNVFGTREDYLIPSACLNSTVSGLVSRTVLRPDLIGPEDFHGGKYYRELAPDDVSGEYIDTITACFADLDENIREQQAVLSTKDKTATWAGLNDIKMIGKTFGIEDINLIKPGVGETTRVLLRRVPWKILVKRDNDPNLKHVLMLAKDKNVPVEVFPDLTYTCCGLIRPR